MKIGIDICEHDRFNLEKVNLITRVLSNEEIKVFNNITNNDRQIEYVCSRFSAKEAIFKAYQSGDKTFNYKDISILNDEFGAPYVLCDRLTDNILISISHSKNYSVCMVVVED